MARKPTEKKVEEAPVKELPLPGTREVLPDGKVKTYFEGGIIRIDN